MAIATASFRNFNLVQGVADAFIQAEEATGIDPSLGKGWLLKRLEILFPPASGIQAVSADFEIGWSLSRDSKTSMSNLNDSDIIYQAGMAGSLTTSGQILIPTMYEYDFPDGIIVVEPSLYAQLDSTATGLTITATMRLFYESVKLSEVDILRMLTQG